MWILWCLQSVLVTVDRHEWYAPPQIYTRDDSYGLWTAKLAIQSESWRLSSSINDIGQGLTSQTVLLGGEVTQIENINQEDNPEMADAFTTIETSSEHSSGEPHSRYESDVGTKKRRVSDLSANGTAVADGSIQHETGELKLENPSLMENEVLREYQGAIAPAVNASFAESVIEPTLVLFEVKILSVSHYSYPQSTAHFCCFLYCFLLVPPSHNFCLTYERLFYM